MILEVKNIEKAFGRKPVLKDINFLLEPGSITGIVGENGSGKTVLMEIIVGVKKAQKGKVHINGKLGYCPQKAMLFSHLTVKEHFDYFSIAYELDKTQSKLRTEELLDHFNFGKYKQERIINLSGGTQQKLNLSLALLHQPNLLILDEPYNGFDWETYERFWNYTTTLKNQGCAILIVTHLLSEKVRLDRIYKLENGILV
ncbi:ABC transporter ATP-binding protein [Algoriphagus sp. CAU 1675]|uniref:ABC transporter ATP-binding protein n=1 Tax=Algoriphagus sp. CAU 1675 TaxID=3032597 RepID=UPI0023DA338F|nr:ABC transporter ATP-binding protein [Algoriphagus sp. CAU 1675]MDF2157089.1 ABC transporter ATP-binding protein [Algoriphagus sp. CAU 1675]